MLSDLSEILQTVNTQHLDNVSGLFFGFPKFGSKNILGNGPKIKARESMVFYHLPLTHSQTSTQVFKFCRPIGCYSFKMDISQKQPLEKCV